MPYTSWFSPARYLCFLTQMALICKTWLQCCDLYKVKLYCSIMGSGKSSTLLNWQPRPGTSPHSLTHTHTHTFTWHRGKERERESVWLVFKHSWQAVYQHCLITTATLIVLYLMSYFNPCSLFWQVLLLSPLLLCWICGCMSVVYKHCQYDA